jgi:hypothetical protein
MLNAKDYPQEKWPFVLRLMSLFQLSFPFDEGGQKQLVPALLAVEEPSAASEPDGAERVRLRYEFNVVPAPLVPRLLVRIFSLIKEHAPLASRSTAPVWSRYRQSLGDAGIPVSLLLSTSYVAGRHPASAQSSLLTAAFVSIKQMASAISSGLISRFNCVCGSTLVRMYSFPSARTIGVSVNPGWITLQRTP